MSIVGTIAQKLHTLKEALGVDSEGKPNDLPAGLAVVLGQEQIAKLESGRDAQYMLGKALGNDEMLGLPIFRSQEVSVCKIEVREEIKHLIRDKNAAHEAALAELEALDAREEL